MSHSQRSRGGTRRNSGGPAWYDRPVTQLTDATEISVGDLRRMLGLSLGDMAAALQLSEAAVRKHESTGRAMPAAWRRLIAAWASERAPAGTNASDSALLAVAGLATNSSDGAYRSADLEWIQRALFLSADEVARLFGVDAAEAASWTQWAPMPLLHSLELDAVQREISQLLTMFEPDRLAAVLRRKADLFEGSTAMSLILSGRIAEVVREYERLLTYSS